MDRERVLQDQSVLVEGDTIRAIGPHVDAPTGTRVIDGHGTDFLSPGLADMHVHSTTSRDMVLFLANGVTIALNMGGATQAFVDQVVPRLNRGTLPGPHAQHFGTTAVGSRADMILSEVDPLTNLSTLQHPLGVMAAGHWHDASDLARLLDGVAAKYRDARWPPETAH